MSERIARRGYTRGRYRVGQVVKVAPGKRQTLCGGSTWTGAAPGDGTITRMILGRWSDCIVNGKRYPMYRIEQRLIVGEEFIVGVVDGGAR